ncbi:MAG: adenylate/guanylate cyclase domain-containing protein [Hyphomicrobiales bacterium]|nr:MAG: adenylate/guanylate cyclase domain-containing protein [Hyphomicrobiales bacterium]
MTSEVQQGVMAWLIGRPRQKRAFGALLGGRTGRLPTRVKAVITSQDNNSEVLVRIIQLLIVAVMGVLYMLAPKTDAGTNFSPVPYALASYLSLTLFGLIWAWNRELPGWSIFASVLFDISLLMVLIWSFHIQYMQPASFYLKAPTLLYIFIFISLRALRFQARYVVAAGLMAALGWLAMIAYVVLSDPHDTMITRDYVAYMTSNSILLGAEFDKIISILLVTGILALAIRRAHSLLVRSVSEQEAARDLSRFFDDKVASQIRDADQAISAGEGVKRDAAVLNVDIRGFTSMAEKMDAGEVMRLLADYQSRLVPLIQAEGGSIDKFMGDGIMATFGAAAPSASPAADALRALDAIMSETDSWSGGGTLARVIVNGAVDAGPVAFGAVGNENRLEYTVIGAPVNFSAKLEKHNKALGCRALVSAKAYEAALAQGYQPPADAEATQCAVHGSEGMQNLVILHR